jgi:NitT/TauT family transport system substrate-binding protein
MPTSRRRTLVALSPVLALSLALSACSSSGGTNPAATPSTGGSTTSATTTVSITVGGANFATLLEYIAKSKGFFAEHGINAKFVQVANGTAGSQAVLSGSVNMSINSVYEVLTAQSKGQNLQYLAGGVKGGFGEIVTAPGVSLPDESSGFPSVITDLKGKKVGVSSIGGGTYYELLFLLKKAGMTSKDVTIVPTGAPATALAALKAGQIDAFMSQEPVTSLALAGKSVKVAYSIGKGPNPPAGSENLMANGVVATGSYISSHAAAVKGVNAAIAQANTYLQGLTQSTASALATSLASDLPGLPTAVVTTAILNSKDNFDSGMSPAGVSIGNQQLIDGGVIKSAVAYTTVVSPLAREK